MREFGETNRTWEAREAEEDGSRDSCPWWSDFPFFHTLGGGKSGSAATGKAGGPYNR